MALKSLNFVKAPYHSTTEAPTTRSLKSDLWEWLLENVPLTKRVEMILKTEKKHKRTDLLAMVMEMKKTNKYHVIDQAAEKEGHQVVRYVISKRRCRM